MPAAALVFACSFALVLALATRGDAGRAVAPVRSNAAGFGEDIRVAGYLEAAEDARITGALHELAALQQLAALANWPQPQPAPQAAVGAVRRASPAPQAARPAHWTDAGFAASVLDALNARRAAAGLPSIRTDGRIANASSSYAMRMSTSATLGHSVDGTTLTSRLAAAGFTEPVMLGEVIAFSSGAPSPDSIVDMWMDSPAHREQILSGSYRLGGAGCAFDGAAVRCVVDLAG